MSSTVPHVTPPHLRDCSTDPLILVVDDDQGVRDLTGSMLEMKGYAVVCASNGEEAVNLFKTFGARIRLLVIDIVMPTMSGPIIAQRAVAVEPGDDAASLQRRIQAEEHRLLPAVVRALARGRLVCEGRRVSIAAGDDLDADQLV